MEPVFDHEKLEWFSTADAMREEAVEYGADLKGKDLSRTRTKDDDEDDKQS